MRWFSLRIQICLVVVSSLGCAAERAKVAYVAGTLAMSRGTQGYLEHGGDREFLIRWTNGKQETRISYHRILFTERGGYTPQATLGSWGLGGNKELRFLTLAYLDDWQRAQILELELKRRADEFVHFLGERIGPVMHDAPSDVTHLAGAYGSALLPTSRPVKLWSSTLPSLAAHSNAVLELGPSGAFALTVGQKKDRIDFGSVTSLEFGQKVGSRAKTALLLSAAVMNQWPLMLMRKRVRHLLSVTFLQNGVPQAIVLELPKYSARTILMLLEMHLGKRVEIDPEKTAAGLYG